jgi:hypothetical protein
MSYVDQRVLQPKQLPSYYRKIQKWAKNAPFYPKNYHFVVLFSSGNCLLFV